MGTFWENFIEANGGIFFARRQFDNLCQQLLTYHYPGKQIINSNHLEEITEFEDLQVIYLPKFFTDNLTNSRKSQIRKAFNKTLNIAREKNLKIFKWIFCTPYTLSEDEEKWWLQWKYKNQEQHNIEIELLDGETIVELLKKYEILDVWKKQQITDSQESLEEEILELEFPEQGQTIKVHKAEKTTEEKKQAETAPEKEQTQEEKEEKTKSSSEQARSSAEEINDKEQPAQSEEEKSETTFKISEKSTPKTFSHKKNIEFIFSEIEKLTKEEKETLDHLRELSDFQAENLKEQIEHLEKIKKEELKSSTKAVDLFLKAKTAEVNKEFFKALAYYELVYQDTDTLNKTLKNKEQEIRKSWRETEKQLLVQEKLLMGDILLSQEKTLEALEMYEDALKSDNKNKEAIIKYNELLGDLFMQSGLYKQAVNAYEKVHENLKNKYKEKKLLLNQKKKIAKKLSLYSDLKPIPLISHIFLFLARWIEEKNPDINLVNPKEYHKLKGFYFSFSLIILIALGYLGYKKLNININLTLPKAEKVQTASVVNLHDVATAKGDYFMEKFKKFGYLRVHVLDSAVQAYQRALNYNRYDNKSLEKLKKAKYYLDAYVNLAEKRLKEEPGKYYRAVKPYSEGLRLVKYFYDPSNQYLYKFGYIDQNNNLVIPPLFDFDYNTRMKEGRESFHHGKAFVCIVIRPGYTAYFQINRYGRRVSKVYFVGK